MALILFLIRRGRRNSDPRKDEAPEYRKSELDTTNVTRSEADSIGLNSVYGAELEGSSKAELATVEIGGELEGRPKAELPAGESAAAELAGGHIVR